MPPRYDQCACGARKKGRSQSCRACFETADRLRAEALRNAGPLDGKRLCFFPKRGRYGLLAVTGYDTAVGRRERVTFAVVDSRECWREVETRVADGGTAAHTRKELIRLIRRWNAEDTRQAA